MASKEDVILPVLWQNVFPQSDLNEHFFATRLISLLMIRLSATFDIHTEGKNVLVLWLSLSIASLLVVLKH